MSDKSTEHTWEERSVLSAGMKILNYFTRIKTSPQVTFTQKSQEQGKSIPFTEMTIYLSKVDDFSKVILL